MIHHRDYRKRLNDKRGRPHISQFAGASSQRIQWPLRTEVIDSFWVEVVALALRSTDLRARHDADIAGATLLG